jgi:amidase
MAKAPTKAQISDIASRFGLSLSEDQLSFYHELIANQVMESFQRLDQLPEPTLPVKYPRTSGYRPTADENQLGAWYWKSEVRGSHEGPLSGKTIVLKDNIALAGVPMMNGTNVLEGYVPNIDATVVTRVLDAGGTILGKAVCESLCFSGGSHTSDTGPVRNPYDTTRSTGGSSSGCAALVANGEADMAIGGDQGGSIRMPSSWCGIYGLKPTHGLVPYTGVFPIEITLDHVGPMARKVSDVALLLEVIAGEDGLDPRQHGTLKPEKYTESLTGDLRGLRIGLVREGFSWDGISEQDVDEAVLQAAHSFERLGCEVKSVSIPLHREGVHIWNGIGLEGTASQMLIGNAMGTNWKGHYATNLLDFYGRGWRARANDLSETVKMTLLVGVYLHEAYHGHYYAKAQNVARLLTAAYDRALQDVDLLVMPTLPFKATPIPESNASLQEYFSRALGMLQNTAPFDVTGHPAMTVPCGMSEGLPIGMMLVGRRGAESTILRAADAFQNQIYAAPVPFNQNR